MFTGIVTHLGKVLEKGQSGELSICIGYDLTGNPPDIGDSMCCEGVCLTAVDLGNGKSPWFKIQVSTETIAKTTIGKWSVGTILNLERSLRVGDELGGHIVSGHVDGTVSILDLQSVGESRKVVFNLPTELAPYIAAKGSVALNGVSLTVNEVGEDSFSVNLIPHTLEVTSFRERGIGDDVNIEIDPIARYVARIMAQRHSNDT
ncbi:MAG: riboflavin synthase [Rhodobacteraceae bacterium]|nr:riboflavin synthase [Paracoccaceae bacterium]MCY4251112.1 riboflavin synthase [Paracoccaceae bacterium]MCY4309228.1 riboflavin synthase [Paracoccaceae bacterium]